MKKNLVAQGKRRFTHRRAPLKGKDFTWAEKKTALRKEMNENDKDEHSRGGHGA